MKARKSATKIAAKQEVPEMTEQEYIDALSLSKGGLRKSELVNISQTEILRKSIADVKRKSNIQNVVRQSPRRVYSGVKSKVAGNLKTEAKVNMRKSLAKYGEEDLDSRPVTYKAVKSRTSIGNAYTSPSPKKRLSAAKSSTMIEKNTTATAAGSVASPQKPVTSASTASFASQSVNKGLIMDSIKQKYKIEDIATMSIDQL